MSQSKSHVRLGDDDVTSEDLWDRLIEAYEEGEDVTISSFGPEMDFDYPYRIVCADRDEKSMVVQSERSAGPDFMRLSLANQHHLEMFVLEIEHGSTYIGDVTQVRPYRRR